MTPRNFKFSSHFLNTSERKKHYIETDDTTRRNPMRNVKKILFAFFLTTICLFFVFGNSPSQESAAEIFEKAFYYEDVQGDLQKAIELYEQILKQFSGNREIAADAQLHIGLCYEKLGKTEAINAYEQVLKNYAGQSKQVAEARARLAALRKEEPAGLSVTQLPGMGMEDPRLSPDGTKAAGTNINGGQNLAVYDFATKKMELLTNYKFGEKNTRWTWVPVWSPTGREIVHQDTGWDDERGHHELWITNLDGKSRFLFKNLHGLAPCDWLPDGSTVLAIQGKENKTSSLGLISVKDGSFRELCPLQRTYNILGNPPSASVFRSADASPDGRLIVFSDGPSGGGQDIYVISAEGGSPVILTDHPAVDMEPRWSPDGRHIVFLSDRHGSLALWGVAIQGGKPDGQPILILEGMQNSWLSTWTRNGLFYETFARIFDVYTLEIDPQSLEAMGKPRVLDFIPTGSNFNPIWSPDGKHLAFYSFSRRTPERFVVVLPSEGGKARKFSFPTDRRQAGSYKWLPDSSGLGMVLRDNEQRLYLARLELDTGEWKTSPISAAGLSIYINSIEWSGDGKSFFIIKKEDDESDESELNITRIDLETGQEHGLFRLPKMSSLLSLKASRDYKRLATGRGGKIVLVDTETGHGERLENEKNYEELYISYPSWSPDGKHLVVMGASNEKSGSNFEIFIISLPDGQLKSLNISRYLPRRLRFYIGCQPDWSPDGRKIVFNTQLFTGEFNLIQNLLPKK